GGGCVGAWGFGVVVSVFWLVLGGVVRGGFFVMCFLFLGGAMGFFYLLVGGRFGGVDVHEVWRGVPN
ncbi:hypothetical protein ABFV58_34075, partial [Pseudomonas protegens]|uniref:hypothetical protein n=1 Tax=Pseudomonas protegens TaxID=380021 RepID=UPI0034D73D8F